MRVRAFGAVIVFFGVVGCGAPAAPKPEVVVVPPAPSAPRQEAASTGVFHPPPDNVANDPSLPPGSVLVRVADADDAPLRLKEVTLETVILRESAAAPEVTAKDTSNTDSMGVAVFRGVHRGPDEQVLVSTRRGDGTFMLPPFRLGATGKRVNLHAYETVGDLAHALVALQTATALTIRADAIEVEVLDNFINLDRIAWVPTDVRVAFPIGVSGFSAADLGLAIRTDDIRADGFRLVGTLAPGDHDLTYQYRLPRERGGLQRIVLPQPPRVAQARVVLDAGAGARLEVEGFPSAANQKAKDGKDYLVTQAMSARSEGGFRQLTITIAGEPR